ncbi:NAD-dependent epimerase [Thalassotalea sp. Y01]|uniref:NAD-dependent epimerase n=1 Tax=Thalassotalea sp. Y01 TaxID=2729613 RepID=UPI00145CB6DC|nr:NAD-dependent epimerase [Thalassotalea sp. Y01]NMP15136.1 NAD-dependent epimerase [Thalassotalea sp. Y01]
MRFLVTGVAGFIGYHLALKLCQQGHEVVGIDNLNDYYNVALKKARLYDLQTQLSNKQFCFVKLDLTDKDAVSQLFQTHKFQRVVHLAAQAGVRYSLDNPFSYADNNLYGHLAILEGCRQHNIEHLVFASSSSVYGLNNKTPYAVSDCVDHPVSLYAATKKSNELMAHSYAHLYDLATTGLRFFTVYGPWGRPDMALFKFTDAIVKGKPIDVFNYGKMRRDFTYIDDIIEGIVRIQNIVPSKNPTWQVETGTAAESSAPYKLYNIGNGQPVNLTDFIDALEQRLGIKAIKNMLPMQPGDVYQTFADSDDLFAVTGFKPMTDIATGICRFVNWYQDYYQLTNHDKRNQG